MKIDAGLVPQRPDQLDIFAKPPHAGLARDLELSVMVLAAEPDAEDRAPAAQIIETRPLMRHMRRVMDRQHDDRRAEADLARDRGGVGQHRHRIEAEDVVEGVLGHPQIAKAERLGTLRHVAHGFGGDRLGRAVRQRDAERDFVFQGHARRHLIECYGIKSTQCLISR